MVCTVQDEVVVFDYFFSIFGMEMAPMWDICRQRVESTRVVSD